MLRLRTCGARRRHGRRPFSVARFLLCLAIFSPKAPASDCSKVSVGLIPLMDLGAGFYMGKQGGLYPGGSNTRPPAHEAAGLARARSLFPLDPSGKRDDVRGKIVFLSIGMSNTTQEFSTFKSMADADPDKNDKVVIVDGAQGGMTAAIISNLNDPKASQFWQTVDGRLAAAGVTPAQVRVAWVKEANAGPKDPFPEEELRLQEQLAEIARILQERFPNILIAYYSSRIYGGYASTALNPEPFAYQSGFAVKWLIEAQIEGSPDLNYDPAKGKVGAPWLSWGPYLWADGLKGRSDGLTYACSDMNPSDGTHPAPGGAREKVARLLLDFLKADSTARPWFLRPERRGGASLFVPALLPRRGNPADPAASIYSGIAVVNREAQATELTFTAFDGEGTPISDAGMSNPRTVVLAPGAQSALLDHEIFGAGICCDGLARWSRVESSAGDITGMLAVMDGSLSLADSAGASGSAVSAFVIPELEENGFLELHMANPNPAPAAVTIELLRADGSPATAPAVRTIAARGAMADSIEGLFAAAAAASDYLRVTSSQGLAPLALMGKPGRYIKALAAQDVGGGGTELYAPQYVAGGDWRTTLSIVNLDPWPGTVSLTLFDREGKPLGSRRTLDIQARGKIRIDTPDFFLGAPPEGRCEGYVVATSGGIRITGSVSFGDFDGRLASSLPLVAGLQEEMIFSQLVSDSDWYTGVAVVNPWLEPVRMHIEVYDTGGSCLAQREIALEAGHGSSRLVTEYLPELASLPVRRGYIRLAADRPVAAVAVYGSRGALAALP